MVYVTDGRKNEPVPGTPGARIRELREERNWTQKDLAARVGNIDHSGVSNIELGRTPLGRRRAAKFAHVFGVTTDEILLPDPAAPTLELLLHRLEEFAADADEGRRVLVNALNRLSRGIERLEGQIAGEAGQAQKRA